MAVADKKMSWAAIAAAKPAKKSDHIKLETTVYQLHPYISIQDTLHPNVYDNPMFEHKYKDDTVIIREKMVRCRITGNEVRATLALLPTKVWILNPSTFLLRPHPKYNLPTCGAFKVEFIHTSGKTRNVGEDMWIVPRLIVKSMPASATARLLAARFCAKRLHADAMSLLIRYMGANVRYYDQITGVESFMTKIDASTEYATINGPPISEERYRGYEAMAYSVDGLLQLVEQGVMDVGRLDTQYKWWNFANHTPKCQCIDCNRNRQIVAFTPDSFHHVFPNGGRSYLRDTYHRVDVMMRIRDNFLKKMEIAGRGKFA
jgi:hypothetical protein